MAGTLESENVVYDVSFECLICHPVENQHIKCKIINITKAELNLFTETPRTNLQ